MLNSFTLYEACNATELTQRLHYNITITSVQEKENKGEEKREREGENTLTKLVLEKYLQFYKCLIFDTIYTLFHGTEFAMSLLVFIF